MISFHGWITDFMFVKFMLFFKNRNKNISDSIAGVWIIPLVLLMISLMFDTLHSHRSIVQYKTAYYSFYLPVIVGIVNLSISMVLNRKVDAYSNSILHFYFTQGCMCIAYVC